MSGWSEPPANGNESGRGDDEVGTLIESAGPRPDVPEADLAAIKAAFRQAWEEEAWKEEAWKDEAASVHRDTSSGFGGWRGGLALAALLLIGLGLAWWRFGDRLSRPDLLVVAEIARIEGTAWLSAAGSDRALAISATDASLPLHAGSLLTTHDGESSRGRIAMRLTDGTRVRLDVDSRLRLLSSRSLELLGGALYVDTGGADANEGVEVRTPIGIARDIGTQFEVRLTGDGELLRIQVREGAVQFEGMDASVRVDRAQALTVGRDGTQRREAVALHGEDWSWILRVAPSYEAPTPTFGDYLAWLVAETGWRVVFAPPEVEAAIRGSRIHGGLGHLDPDETLDVVLPSLGFDYRLEGGVLTLVAP